MASAVLIGCLATLGVIIAILLLLAGGYLWWRHKRSQLQFVEPNEDEESSNGSMRLQQSIILEAQGDIIPVKQLQQQPPQQPQNNINRKLNGFLNLKTPLIGYVQHYFF